VGQRQPKGRAKREMADLAGVRAASDLVEGGFEAGGGPLIGGGRGNSIKL